MEHSFDVDIAKEFGILEAILLKNLEYWIAKNKANNTNFYDGYYWTYNSTKAFNELFPYASKRQIEYALKHLKDEGIIQTENYNKSAYDRTLWYTITKEGESILQNCKMEVTNPGECISQNCKMEMTKLSNGNYTDVTPIPNINTDIKPNNKHIERGEKQKNSEKLEAEENKKKNAKRFTPPTLEEVRAYCLERNNTINPERFIDFYESNGWLVGKNKMKNWKAAVRTWEGRDSNNKPKQRVGPNGIRLAEPRENIPRGIKIN